MILDIFTILFEADTSKAKEGVDDTRKSTEQLTEEMIKADKQADKTGAGMAGFAAKALGALTAVLSVGTAISGAVGRAEDIAAIERTSNAIGETVENVDAFGRAMELLGGDAQGARDSLTDMAESIGEAMQDVESGRAKTFGALGVSLRDISGQAIGPIEAMMRLSDAVQGMSQGEAVFRIKELGITDNRTVEAILKGRKELERLIQVQKDSNPLTKEQVERARQFTETMGAWKNSVGSASAQFFDKLIPALTKAVEWLTKIVNWAGEHKDFVVAFFSAIAAIVMAVYLPAMVSAAAATLAATWPFLLIGAAIVAAAAAFALIYDDIMNFIDGNDSMIGQIFEKYPIVKDIIFGIIDAFKAWWDMGVAVFDFLYENSDSILGAFKAMGDGIVAIFEWIAAAWKLQFDIIMKGVDMVKTGLMAVGDFFGFGGGGDSGPALAEANAQVAAASANSMNSISSNAISNMANNNKETNVQIGQVTVETQATDSQGISQAIGGDLSTQLKNLEAETATGIDR